MTLPTAARAPGARPHGLCLVLGLLSLLGLGGCGEALGPALYAGTSIPKVRVLLGKARTTGRIEVTGQSWEVVGERGAAWEARDMNALRATFSLGSNGIRFWGRDTGADVLRLRAPQSFSLDDRTYEGELLVRRAGERLEFINELDLESYVAGVIANEVGPQGVPAMFRAQSVAARTYAWMRITTSDARDKPFHVYDDARSQVYSGRTIPAEYGLRYEDMRRAVRQTAGVLLTFQGRPFTAYYSSTCGGHTTDPGTSTLDPGAARDVMQGVPCEHCKSSRYYTWTQEIDEEALVQALKGDGRPISPPIHDLRISRRGRGNWVAEVEIVWGPKSASKSVPGPTFRSLAGLRSHNLESITRLGSGRWRVKGRGWGHGVGMCQWGAIEMARNGANETDILSFYYPGSSLVKLY